MIEMKLNCFKRPPKFTKRLIIMLLGIFLQGFGLAWLRKITFGIDPCSCFVEGVSNMLPITFGTCQLIFQAILFFIVVFSDMSYIGFGTVANMCLLGYISDFFVWLWERLLPAELFQSMVPRIIILIPALALFLLGAATYMCSGLGTSPYDGVPFIISTKLKKAPFRIIRTLWDILFMILGFFCGGTVGVVTVGVALFCGPVVSYVGKRLERIF